MPRLLLLLAVYVPLSSPKGLWHLSYTRKELGLDTEKGNLEVWCGMEKLCYSLSWKANKLTLKSAKCGVICSPFGLRRYSAEGGGQTGELSHHEHGVSDPAVREYAHAGTNKAKRCHFLPNKVLT